MGTVVPAAILPSNVEPVVELDHPSGSEAEVTVGNGADRAAARPHDGKLSIARESPSPGGAGHTVGYDESSVDQLQREIALWTSTRMRDLRDLIARAALSDVAVLITGETGTGKDLVARAIHYQGARRHGPFVRVNCAAVALELLESELFGHERGAFTGAHQLKVGKFEAAHRGTIFLDEIGDLHPDLQAKLLHVWEEGRVWRVGGRTALKLDVRMVTATNRNLEDSVAAGRFREDLFYRLNVVRISVPPLRQRAEEISSLARYFVERYARLFQREEFVLSPDTMLQLRQHSFPGNVRELENMIKRMIVLDDLTPASVPLVVAPAGSVDPFPLRPATAGGSLRSISRKAAQAAEQSAILKALEETKWNRLRAAKLLKISYRALLYKIKEAGLDGKRQAADLT
jgi:two-component system response regulator AtoC